MSSAQNGLGKSKGILLAVVENSFPGLGAARKATADFQSMFRSKSAAKIDGLIELVRTPLRRLSQRC